MNIISRKTVTRSLLGLALVIGCIVDNGKILKYQAQVSAKGEAREQKIAEQSQEELRTSQAQSDSQIAMSRAQSGCVQIVLTKNNKPVRFHENLRVFDPNTFPTDPRIARFDRLGNPINGVQPMPPGITVCNREGDTALIGELGYITKIYRVEPSKLQEFRGYLK
jgi:hypothetical protein